MHIAYAKKQTSSKRRLYARAKTEFKITITNFAGSIETI